MAFLLIEKRIHVPLFLSRKNQDFLLEKHNAHHVGVFPDKQIHVYVQNLPDNIRRPEKDHPGH